MKIKITIAIVLGLLSYFPANADTIFLKNGMRLDVDRAWKENQQVKYEMFGSVYTYSVDEVIRIEKGKGQKKTDEEHVDHIADSNSSPENENKNLMEIYSKQFLRFYKNRKWKKAIGIGKELYQLDPKNKAIRDMLSHSYMEYAASQRQSGKLPEEIQALKKAAYYAPWQKTVLKKLTAALSESAGKDLDRRDYGAAKVLLLEARDLDPENPEPYILLGKIAYDTNDYSSAKSNWLKALKLKPGHTGVRYLLKSLEKDRKVEKNLQVYESGNFILKFHGTKKQLVVDKTISILDKAYLDVGRELGVYPDEKICVLVYPKSDLEKLDYLPDWSAGRYDGKIRIGEDMCKRDDYFAAILYHEYTHSIVHILGGNKVPLWLNEGMAEYASRQLKPEKYVLSRKKLLGSAAEKNRLIPMKVLAKMNGYGLSRLPVPMIQLVYAQSESFVTYLVKRYSIFDIKRTIKETGKGTPPDTAIKRILYSDLETLEKDWKKHLADRSNVY